MHSEWLLEGRRDDGSWKPIAVHTTREAARWQEEHLRAAGGVHGVRYTRVRATDACPQCGGPSVPASDVPALSCGRCGNVWRTRRSTGGSHV